MRLYGNKTPRHTVWGVTQDVKNKEVEWAGLMRAANAGDTHAYRRVLEALAPVIRSTVHHGFARWGSAPVDVEDVVQETLLAIHLKRHTWTETEPILPWIRAIARNKLIDMFRRRGRRIHVDIEDFIEVLPAPENSQDADIKDARRLLHILKGRQREVVEAISLEGASIREVAERLNISEGGVRVALHRGLAALAVAYKDLQP